MNSLPADTSSPSTEPPRRSFFARIVATIAGGIALVFPFAAGSGVFFDPLGRRRQDAAGDENEMAGYSRICALDALPADGMPHQFAVIADTTDAWTRTRGERIGMVFLKRQDEGDTPKVSAFTATCPHLGCAVEFDAAKDQFECPCHVSGFSTDGRKLFGPSLRGLDALDVKLADKDGTQEVWVAFQHFRAGVAERIPVG
ncbi:MAG TPA: Rieske 2Fe-2S domain-containing protein [Lacipirellulaceae bacterium]